MFNKFSQHHLQLTQGPPGPPGPPGLVEHQPFDYAAANLLSMYNQGRHNNEKGIERVDEDSAETLLRGMPN